MSDDEFEFLAYYLKRGETIQGPLKRSTILQAATGKKLLSGDQIANFKDGPWLDITKEPLQRMQQGSDIEIRSTERWVTTPPKGRAELKKWLRANKDESSVSCPHCSASVKHSNLLQHCDKLHYSRLSTTGSSLPVSQAATKNPAGKSKKPWVTTPPKDRAKLMKWLQSNGDQLSVSCPHCGVSVKRRNLIKHCDKLHFEPKDNRQAVLKNTVFAVAAIALGLLVLIAGAWGLWGLGGWLWGLATQGWANSGAFRVAAVCIGVGLALWVCVKLGKEGVLFILGTTYFVFCCWGMYAIVASFQPEGTLQWFRALAGAGFGVFMIGMICGGVFTTGTGILKTITGDDNPASEGDNVIIFMVAIPVFLGFICLVIGGIGAILLWLYSG